MRKRRHDAKHEGARNLGAQPAVSDTSKGLFFLLLRVLSPKGFTRPALRLRSRPGSYSSRRTIFFFFCHFPTDKDVSNKQKIARNERDSIVFEHVNKKAKLAIERSFFRRDVHIARFRDNARKFLPPPPP